MSIIIDNDGLERDARAIMPWRPLSGTWTWAYKTAPLSVAEAAHKLLAEIISYQSVENTALLNRIMLWPMWLSRSKRDTFSDRVQFDQPWTEGRWPPWRACLRRRMFWPGQKVRLRKGDVGRYGRVNDECYVYIAQPVNRKTYCTMIRNLRLPDIFQKSVSDYQPRVGWRTLLRRDSACSL